MKLDDAALTLAVEERLREQLGREFFEDDGNDGGVKVSVDEEAWSNGRFVVDFKVPLCMLDGLSVGDLRSAALDVPPGVPDRAVFSGGSYRWTQ